MVRDWSSQEVLFLSFGGGGIHGCPSASGYLFLLLRAEAAELQATAKPSGMEWELRGSLLAALAHPGGLRAACSLSPCE